MSDTKYSQIFLFKCRTLTSVVNLVKTRLYTGEEENATGTGKATGDAYSWRYELLIPVSVDLCYGSHPRLSKDGS